MTTKKSPAKPKAKTAVQKKEEQERRVALGRAEQVLEAYCSYTGPRNALGRPRLLPFNRHAALSPPVTIEEMERAAAHPVTAA